MSRTVPTATPAAVAALVLRRALERPATLGTGRLVCIDGPAGSGKTTLADAVVTAGRAHGRVALVHMDDVYEGWHGLDEAVERVATEVVRPLRAALPGAYRRYDWHAGHLAERRVVEPVDLLVMEGVGSGATAYADATTVLAWVEAPRDLRLQRGLDRDGEQVRGEWLAWMRAEEALHARERTRERADVHVDGTGLAAPVLT